MGVENCFPTPSRRSALERSSWYSPLEGEVIEVLVSTSQVRQVTLPEGRAIGGVPADR